MMFAKYIAVFIFLLTSSWLKGQQRIGNFMAYGTANGLGQNSYHDVFESSDGYLWIGSNAGLYKFDGKRFNPIISSYNDANSPGEGNTVGFAEDDDQNLWMAGFTKGVTRYNLKTGVFKRYPRLSADSNATYGTFCVYKDTDGIMWMGTAGRGLAKYISQTDSFQLYVPDPSKSADGSKYGENVVTGVVQDDKNTNLLWLSCLDGLYAFNKKTAEFTKYENNLSQTSNGVLGFLSIEQLSNKIYLGTWFAGLVIFDKETTSFSRVPYSQQGKTDFNYGILDLQAMGDSAIYLAAMNDGLLQYNLNTQKIKSVLQTSDVSFLNRDINIQKVSVTPHAGFFAGGNAHIYQLHANSNAFSKLVKYPAVVQSVNNEANLLSMVYNAGKDGYYAIFQNFNGIVLLNNQLGFTKTIRGATREGWFKSIAVSANQNVWAIHNQDELFYAKTTDEILQPAVNFEDYSLASLKDKFRNVITDANGNLWLMGRNNVYYYSFASKKITTFSWPKQDMFRKHNSGIRFFTWQTDSKSNAWMSSNIGLFKFDLAKNKTIYYADSLQASTTLANISIKSFAIDKTDHLWLGYFNEGIQKVNSATMQIEASYFYKDGLPDAEINYLACDNENNIIACLHNGLTILKKGATYWQVFNANDGLKRDYLDVPAFFGKTNTIILDQKDGWLPFSVNNILKKPQRLHTHITSLTVNGKPYAADLLPDYIQSIQLPFDTKEIIIAFSVANWEAPLKTNYFYRVDGIHEADEWIPSPDAKVHLTGLASGKYQFRFYAITADGSKTTERSIFLEVKPPFYKTAWFIILCLLAIFTLAHLLYRYRIGQLKKLQNIRNNIARDLHDEIGSALTSIKILSEISGKTVYQDREKTAVLLQKISEQSAAVQQGISDIVWAVNPANDKLENMVIRMREYITHTMEQQHITTHFSIDEAVLNKTLDMHQRRDFFLIFKEAINNIVKHAAASKVEIILTQEHRNLQLMLTDNGKGFSLQKQHAGNGLKNMKARAAHLKAVFEIKTSIDGCKLILSIPTTQ